nr:MAG TPA: hypothetical protein [Bacteriophage sp.]
MFICNREVLALLFILMVNGRLLISMLLVVGQKFYCIKKDQCLMLHTKSMQIG